MPVNTILGLFAKSPLTPLQEHIRKVHECCTLLRPFFRAVEAGDWTSAAQQQQAIAPVVIYTINAAEDAVSAMLLVVMLTLVMQYSRLEYAATDFTFQVAVMATVSGVLYSLSGLIGDVLGYTNYLFLIVFIAIFCLVTIFRWMKFEK